jgi:hypothetical protein
MRMLLLCTYLYVRTYVQYLEPTITISVVRCVRTYSISNLPSLAVWSHTYIRTYIRMYIQYLEPYITTSVVTYVRMYVQYLEPSIITSLVTYVCTYACHRWAMQLCSFNQEYLLMCYATKDQLHTYWYTSIIRYWFI